jgi:hypothetical protein
MPKCSESLEQGHQNKENLLAFALGFPASRTVRKIPVV